MPGFGLELYPATRRPAARRQMTRARATEIFLAI
jgi:hypothetical protein